ncbi:MAG: response regulator [Bacteroidota bacterium]
MKTLIKEKKILLVDNDPKILQVLASFLKREEYDISYAQTKEETLELVGKNDYDLILLDIMLSPNGQDGFEICKSLKADPAKKNIPIIFLTVKKDTLTKEKAFKLGGQDYIIKPLNAIELLARVRTHLELKEINEELSVKNRLLEKEIEELQLQLGNISSKEYPQEIQNVFEKFRLATNELVKLEQIKNIKIALASTEDLASEREKLELHFLRKNNKSIRKNGIQFSPKVWTEQSIAFNPRAPKQEEFNQFIRESDFAIFIVKIRIGRYTEEEFKVAIQHAKEFGKPKIYLFLQKTNTNLLEVDVEELKRFKEFQREIEQELKQVYWVYDSFDEMVLKIEKSLAQDLEDF